MIDIKKIIFVVILCLFFTGCSDKEVLVKNSGDSLAYNFFKGYNKDKYTLKLKNDNKIITIIKDNDKVYYCLLDNNSKMEIIEKDNIRYTLNSDNYMYTKENIESLTDYASGYLQDKHFLKTADYKKGKERINVFKYVYETYSYDGGSVTYYFNGNKLKYILNKTPLSETMLEFISMSKKIDSGMFDIPSKYQELEY